MKVVFCGVNQQDFCITALVERHIQEANILPYSFLFLQLLLVKRQYRGGCPHNRGDYEDTNHTLHSSVLYTDYWMRKRESNGY